MVKDTHRQRIPNDHGSEIGIGLLKEILRQAGIPDDEWDGA
jgi:predicted RNA binding protein YcfA (HicA-like mRNA interferase family)